MRSYGTVTYEAGKWVVAAEAHVMLRAKRVFAQVCKGSMGKLTMLATPSTTRDLEWFLQRFPMTVDDPARLDELARRHDAAMASVQGILDRGVASPTFELAVPARAYQRVAANLALSTGRLLLADDLGLGKTCSGICVISEQRCRPAVVVTMTHLPQQWTAQFTKFAPSLRIHCPKKRQPTDADRELLGSILRPDVVVIGYSKLDGWAETLVEWGARCVVFDEMQDLRTGIKTAKGKGAAHIAGNCAVRMGLTATPVYNYGDEIFNLLEILEPGCLGDSVEFEREWCTRNRVNDPRALGTHLREHGLMLRRVGEDVSEEVPQLAKPIRIPHLVDADTKAIAKAQTAAAEFARILLASSGKGIDKMGAAGEIDWRLRQATGIAKAGYVAEFVRVLLASEAKVLLYGWHHAVYALWREALAEFDPVCFTGDESPAQKEVALQRFTTGGSRVLIMSLRSGAGVDGLQEACRCVVFGELDWSPGVHEQCIGRVHRPGQRDTVRAYFLHADEGSDPFVVEVLGIKEAQSKGIRDPLAPSSESVGDKRDGIRLMAEACLRAAGESAPALEEAA